VPPSGSLAPAPSRIRAIEFFYRVIEKFDDAGLFKNFITSCVKIFP